jgi:hypothetical protein
MRRTLVNVIAAGVLAVVAVGTAGCARGAVAGGPSAKEASARDGPAGALQAAIYVPVLRRYLGTPAENSFPGHAFKTVYVLDQAFQTQETLSVSRCEERSSPRAPNTKSRPPWRGWLTWRSSPTGTR